MLIEKPSISICIPAYKRVVYLKRLLESILIQRYKDFEIIISDDSDDDSVLQLIQSYSDKLTVRYFKNTPSLGTPANWNFAITKATGEWIKLIHDDDWFASGDALAIFAEYAGKTTGKFIFSGYNNYYESAKTFEKIGFSSTAAKRIIHAPVTLLANNVIGPPSVTLVHHSISEKYDERMQWRVDLDFYIRILLEEKRVCYIDKTLVNVGISESQVTNQSINIVSVELPEGYWLLEKYGTKPLSNVLIYDAWWRILRNLRVKNKEQLEQFGQKNWPAVITSLVNHQAVVPQFLLNMGISSKFAMFCSYCINYFKSNF